MSNACPGLSNGGARAGLYPGNSQATAKPRGNAPMAIMSLDAAVASDPKPREGWLVPRRQAWFAFTMAFLLMTFDFIDRQVVVAMFPALKSAWGLSDKQLGALISSVSITIAVFSFPIALFADRWSRVKSIAGMAVIWSVATVACGFSRSYGQLLAAR